MALINKDVALQQGRDSLLTYLIDPKLVDSNVSHGGRLYFTAVVREAVNGLKKQSQ